MGRIINHTYGGDSGQNVELENNFLGYGLLHYSIIRNIQPDTILCVGSREGFIPALLASACKDNHKGHVHFVDAGYDKKTDKHHWSGIGYWKNNNLIKHFSKINVSKYITSHIMTTKEYYRNNKNRTYQYIYIDGDHSLEGVTLDYKLFWPQLSKGGFMVFHDTTVKYTKDLGKFGVWKLWNKIGKSNAINFKLPLESGLGIKQKM